MRLARRVLPSLWLVRPSAALSTSARAAVRSADAVCFDVDSTVITEEGIDVLAAHLGAGEAVAALTAQAMGGSMAFQDALAARLAIIRPSRAAIAACLAAHPLELSPGIEELVSKLGARGTDVYLVSGGFRLMIEPVRERLGLAPERVFANTLLFESDAEGTYRGFDDQELTSRAGGKAEVVKRLKAERGYGTVVMVGDGATDMEASPPADAFIGFGGVVVRDAVKKGADWFVTDFEEVIREVEVGAAERK